MSPLDGFDEISLQHTTSPHRPNKTVTLLDEAQATMRELRRMMMCRVRLNPKAHDVSRGTAWLRC